MDIGDVTKRSEQNDSLPQTTAVVKRLWVTKQVIAKVETFMKQWYGIREKDSFFTFKGIIRVLVTYLCSKTLSSTVY